MTLMKKTIERSILNYALPSTILKFRPGLGSGRLYSIADFFV